MRRHIDANPQLNSALSLCIRLASVRTLSDFLALSLKPFFNNFILRNAPIAMGIRAAWWHYALSAASRTLPAVRFFVELFHCLLPCHLPSSEAFRVCYPPSGSNAKQFGKDASQYTLTSIGKQELLTTDNVLESIRSATVQTSSDSFQHVDTSSGALKGGPVTANGLDFATVSGYKHSPDTKAPPAHSRYYTEKILKHLKTLLDDPELKTHGNAPDDPGINFGFQISYKFGILFIAISKAGLSFWVHAPATPGPSGGSAAPRRGRGGGRGGRRTGAGVVRSRGGRGGGRAGPGRNTNGVGDDNADDGEGDGDGYNDDNNNNNDNYDGLVVVTTRFLACPFYKFDPVRHFRCFRKYDLKRYSDVKQHILRCHSLGQPGNYYHCQFCWKTWKSDNEAGWRAHIFGDLAQRRCDYVPEPEHLLQSEVNNMNDLEFGQQANDAQKWYRLWDLLFRGHARPQSPYVETELGEIPQLLARSRDDVMQAMPALLHGSNIQADYLTMQALVYHIHNIYCSQFTPQGQQQAPRHRRQYAAQDQAQPPVQVFGQAPNTAVDAALMNTVAPGMLTLNNDDDLSQFINQQGADDMMDMMDNFQQGPPAPPPPPAPQGY